MVGWKISKEIDQKKLLEWQKKGALLSPSVKKALAL